ncbi:MAG: 4-(cytidine 5'-diphospho)-2-C-methyl-D-erythritol kinase [Neomegalonema sp.]|nr:4-(cytidine 5'-diphospho)-2-C-methyl-D-erythritol kinase [Neomegalonema sp.]
MSDDLTGSDALGSRKAAASPVREFARAKVNLFLHILGQRPDGLHRLESLAVFPRIGDTLEFEPGTHISLSIDGPFAGQLSADSDNLVLRAAGLLSERHSDRALAGAAMRLTKRLPIASGIGGGSADAAAALRGLMRLWRLDIAPRDLAQLARRLGADVPVCLDDKPQFMGGIGEELVPAPPLPSMAILLVNPGIAVSTPSVFQALTRKQWPAADPMPVGADLAALVGWLSSQRNDLQEPACTLCPPIRKALSALEALDGQLLTRMSGSGASCFALFESLEDAQEGARRIALAHPQWWQAVGLL